MNRREFLKDSWSIVDNDPFILHGEMAANENNLSMCITKEK